MAEETKKRKEKKYVWLKLQEGFFRDKRMKKLRRIAGGDVYTIIYLKMQLLSLRNKGLLLYEGVEDSFAEEIAEEIDESFENVQVTINFLQRYGLIEEVHDNQYLLPEAAMNIGSESESAERVRRYRERKNQEKLEKPDEIKALPAPEDEPLHCNDDVTKRNDYIEAEQDKEAEQEAEEEKEADKQTDIELTPIQMNRVELLRDMFASWDIDDYKIFHLSTLVNKRIPYDPTLGVHGLDLKIYHILDDLVMRAKIYKVEHIYAWMLKVIPEYEGIE